jgi:hypothetical protein
MSGHIFASQSGNIYIKNKQLLLHLENLKAGVETAVSLKPFPLLPAVSEKVQRGMAAL